MKSRYLWLAIILVCFVIAACATSAPYNPFKVPEEDFFGKINTIVLAPVYVPTDLENPEPVRAMFESMLEARLRAGGFSVVPCKTVWQTREQVIEKLGGIYDPTTGKADKTKIEAVRVQMGREVCKKFKADALLYPRVVYVKANFSKNRAHWDGVDEYIGPGGTFGAIGLDIIRQTWSGRVRALSFTVSIQDSDGVRMYLNRGGIQTLNKITTYGKYVPVAREELFADEERNNEAVEIAIGPLVKNPN
jgi:hypothetical protein